MVQPLFENSDAVSYKVKHAHATPRNPTFGIYPSEIKTYVHTETVHKRCTVTT